MVGKNDKERCVIQMITCHHYLIKKIDRCEKADR